MRKEGNFGKILTRYLPKAIKTARKGASKKSLCPLSLRVLCVKIILAYGLTNNLPPLHSPAQYVLPRPPNRSTWAGS